MLAPYRELLRIPGAWQFTLAGFFARTPFAMLPLAIILFVSDRSGSFAIAGALVAAYQIPNATISIYTSRLTDRYGQRVMTSLLTVGYAVGLTGFIIAVLLGVNWWVVALMCAFTGAMNPAIGSVVRARWAYVVGPSKVGTAFAMESTLDELNWTIAPLITAVLATAIAPVAPMLLAVTLALVAGLAYSLQGRTAPPANRGNHEHHELHQQGILRTGLLYVVAIAAGIGVLFGSFEIAVVAFCDIRDAHTASGIVLALWALGSMLGGLWFGTRVRSTGLGRTAAIQLTVLAVLMIPSLFVGQVWLLAVVTLIAGAAVAPTLITGFSLAERLVPPASVTEGLTWTLSGITLGFALGSAVAGKLIDARGVTAGFLLAFAGSLVALVVAWLAYRALDRNVRTDDIPPAIAPIDEPVPGPLDAPGA